MNITVTVTGGQAAWTLCCTGRRRVKGSGITGSGIMEGMERGWPTAGTSGNHWKDRGGGKRNGPK